MARTTNPDYTAVPSRDHDKIVKDGLASCMESQRFPGKPVLTPAMEKQAELPCRDMPGLNLFSVHRTRHAAYIASYSAAASHVSERLGHDNPVAKAMERYFDVSPRITLAAPCAKAEDHRVQPVPLVEVAKTIIADISRDDEPSSEDIALIPTTFMAATCAPHKLQHEISQVQHKVALARLTRQVNLPEQTRLKSCAQRGASMLFQVRPTEFRMQVPNEVMSHKLRLYLGCPQLAKFSAEQARKCRMCKNYKDIVSAPQHIVNCGVGGGPQVRHNGLRDTFQSMFRSAHLPTRVEVRAELPHTGIGGPDLEVADFPQAGQTTIFDVSVVNPVQDHFLHSAGGTALVAANSREREKVNTYRKTAERMGARIIPLVFEATGAFGTDTLKTVANFSKLYKQKNGEEFGPCSSAVFPATDPAIYWKHILAVSFAKGTYDMSVYIDRAGHQSSAASGPRRR